VLALLAASHRFTVSSVLYLVVLSCALNFQPRELRQLGCPLRIHSTVAVVVHVNRLKQSQLFFARTVLIIVVLFTF